MINKNIRNGFSSSFVLLAVSIGDRKAHLTLSECHEYIDWWTLNRDNFEAWMASENPNTPLMRKVWQLGLNWSEHNALYNDCIRMKAANLKYDHWIGRKRYKSNGDFQPLAVGYLKKAS